MFNPKILKVNNPVKLIIVKDIVDEFDELFIFYAKDYTGFNSGAVCIRYHNIISSAVGGVKTKALIEKAKMDNSGSNVKSGDVLPTIECGVETTISYYFITSDGIIKGSNQVANLKSTAQFIQRNNFLEDTILRNDSGKPLVYSFEKEDFESFMSLNEDKLILDFDSLSDAVKFKEDEENNEEITLNDFFSYQNVIKDTTKKALIELLSSKEDNINVSYPGMDTGVIDNMSTVFIKDGDLFIGNISNLSLSWSVETGGQTSYNITKIKSTKDFLNLSSKPIKEIIFNKDLKPFIISDQNTDSIMDWRNLCYLDFYKFINFFITPHPVLYKEVAEFIKDLTNYENVNYIWGVLLRTMVNPVDKEVPDEAYIYVEDSDILDKKTAEATFKILKKLFTTSAFLELSIKELTNYLYFYEPLLHGTNSADYLDLNTWISKENTRLVEAGIRPVTIDNFEYVLPAKHAFSNEDYFYSEILSKMQEDDSEINLSELYRQVQDYSIGNLFYEEGDEPKNITNINFNSLVNKEVPYQLKADKIFDYIQQFRGLNIFYKNWWKTVKLFKRIFKI